MSGVRAPTAVQASGFDRWAIDRLGVPEPALMENAGRQAALLLNHLHPGGPVTALVGSGNNGGDALVCLRALAAWGRKVTAIRVGAPRAGDPLLHGWDVPAATLDEAAGALAESAVIVDGMLGTGIRGAPRPAYAAAIRAANAAGRPVVALDAPSGVDGTTGAVPGEAIRAEMTVAFGWPKLGALLHPGRALCGRIVAVEIGFPPELPDDWARIATPEWAAARLPRRAPDAHKNRVGALTVVAGSAMAGAAILAARAAFRCGVGLLRVCGADVVGGVPEAIVVDAADQEAVRAAVEASDAVAVGPGLGTGAEAARLLRLVLDARGARPTVVDADALTLLASGAAGELPSGSGVAFTPHPGEMARLTGQTVRAVQADRIGAATAFARTHGVVTVLKGAPTLVAGPRGRLVVSATDRPSALAVAGMGDVLTGAVGAFLAQGVEARTACALALSVTGRAASASGLGASLTPSDVVAGLPEVLAGRRFPASELPFPFVTFDQPAPG